MKNKEEKLEDNIENRNNSISGRYRPPLNFKFPQKEIFGTKRRCKQEWFESYDWLHYDSVQDSVFCFVCMKVYQQNKLLTNQTKRTFVSGKGFSDWSHANKAFMEHLKSDCHLEAISKQNEVNIGKIISADYKKQEEQNRECLVKIIEILRLLGRQGLPFRGHGDERNGNFNQFLKFQGKYFPELDKWTAKETNKYTSNKSQKEIIEIKVSRCPGSS